MLCWSALATAALQRADDAVDQGLRGALVGHGLEQLGELADRHAELHPVVLDQHLLQLALGRVGLAACFLDDAIWPRVAPILRRMRSLSTSRPCAMLATASTAPEATSAKAENAGHSVCQPLTPRSCSCTCAAKIATARLGARAAAASAAPARLALRLCGGVAEL